MHGGTYMPSATIRITNPGKQNVFKNNVGQPFNGAAPDLGPYEYP